MTDEKLTDEIRNHLATFPERHNDVLEMKREWTEFKSKALWIFVSFLGGLLGIGVWVGTIQSEHSRFAQQIASEEARYKQMETRLGALEVTNGAVLVRLASIDATLQEIKVAIRELR